MFSVDFGIGIGIGIAAEPNKRAAFVPWTTPKSSGIVDARLNKFYDVFQTVAREGGGLRRNARTNGIDEVLGGSVVSSCNEETRASGGHGNECRDDASQTPTCRETGELAVGSDRQLVAASIGCSDDCCYIGRCIAKWGFLG